MSKNKSLRLLGSMRLPPAARRIKVTPQNKRITFCLRLAQGSCNLPQLAEAVKDGKRTPLSLSELENRPGKPSAAVLARVKKALDDAGFSVLEYDPLSRTLKIEGSARLIRKHFGAVLNEYENAEGLQFTARRGELAVADALGISAYVQGVHGIDGRPKAQPRSIRKDVTAKGRTSEPNVARSWNARSVAERYGVPLNKLGAGFAVGFVSLGGGLDPRVVARANARLGLPAPRITIITVDGASNSPSGGMDGADGENYLDSQIQAAVAPAAEQIMSIGPNSITGFANALLALARHSKRPSKISISWGAREDSDWSDDDRALFDQALQICMSMGISVFCAAGDDGSSDGAKDGKSHCDYPGSSPWQVSCSGVYDNGTLVKAWNSFFGGATGGGVSLKYPAYTPEQLLLRQAGVSLPVHADTGAEGRVVGDIAGIADPSTGIEVLGPSGRVHVIGGTSAVSPFHAAAGVCLDSELGRVTPHYNAALYRLTATGRSVCVPVTKGNNGAYSCKEGDVFNAVCGLGTVDYDRFFKALVAGLV